MFVMLSEKEFNIQKGSELLKELHLYAGHQMLIDVEKLGYAINNHQQLVITIEVVKGKKSWVLRDATETVIKKAWGHGYLITGKHWQRIGGNAAKASRPQLKSAKPLKREEVKKAKREAEEGMKRMASRATSPYSSSNALLNKAKRKMESEKRLLEKVDKGILPKAKIIYTPMGNDRRRK